jgi:two-component sensor histidine kinase
MEKSFHTDLIAETNHRVANSLALLSGLVRIQAHSIGKNSTSYSNAEIGLMFDGVAARIATVGQLHRMLARAPGEGSMALNPHLHQVCDNLIATFSSEKQPVRIEYRGSDCLVLTKHVQPLTLIICEVLTNALKHAHPAGLPVKLTVACEAADNGTLCVTLSDDGVGLPEGFDPQKDGGVGFRIIRALASEMGADLIIKSDDLGAIFHLSVPQALVANARRA